MCIVIPVPATETFLLNLIFNFFCGRIGLWRLQARLAGMNNFSHNEMWYMVPKIFSLWINCMPQKYALICCHYLFNITVSSSILGECTCMWFRGHLELGCIYAYTCEYIASRESSNHHIHLYLFCANYQTMLCPPPSLTHTHTHIRAWK